jgi:Tfp pilus assembly protein PilV
MVRILNKSETGFTLIEAVISVGILSIGFAGVIGLVGVSNEMLHNSTAREQLNAQGAAIIDTLYSDPTNIEVYQGKNLANCSSLSTPSGKELHLRRLKKWCSRASNRVGAAQNLDHRKIHVVKRNNTYIVGVEITSNDGKNSAFVKRVINVP